jgi:hypothetical protein
MIDIFMIQNFVFGDGVFIILFCSLRGSISQNTGTLKCWNKVHQYCGMSNHTSITPCIGYTKVHANMSQINITLVQRGVVLPVRSIDLVDDYM